MEKTVTLTAAGKRRASDITDRNPAMIVLSALSEQGPMTFPELAKRVKMNTNQVKDIARELWKQGCVQVAGEGTDDN